MAKPTFTEGNARMQRLTDDLAEKLEAEVRANPALRLSSIRAMAAARGVSYPTMWKAVQSLVQRGVLATRPGRRVAAPVDGRCPDASEHLLFVLRQRILDGAYRAGMRLPKTVYLAATENLSSHTVTRACVLLMREGLLHRQGRRWIVGPAREISGSRQSQPDHGVVLLIAPDPNSRTSLFSSPPISQFGTTAYTELHNARIRFAFALSRHYESMVGIPSGSEEIRAYVKDLGQRYRGALIHCAWPKIERIETTINDCLALGKPVVFFDHTNQGGYIAPQLTGAQHLYTRPHLDNATAVRMALETLTALGHHTIGIHGSELFDWAQQRTGEIRQAASRLRPAPTIVTAGPSEPSWNFTAWSGTQNFVDTVTQRAIQSGGRRTLAALRTSLIDAAPSLVALLRDHQPTALLALDDPMAREYHFWLAGVGVQVPRHLSLLSFDNQVESCVFPISSIDFGYIRLGYLAAHIFIGDIPVARGPAGDIAGICTCIDRGSVGPEDASGYTRRLLAR